MKKIDLFYEIGLRIQYLRFLKKWTQEDLAFHSGVNTHYICDMENGKRNPTIKVLNRVAISLGVTLEDFFKGINGNIM